MPSGSAGRIATAYFVVVFNLFKVISDGMMSIYKCLVDIDRYYTNIVILVSISFFLFPDTCGLIECCDPHMLLTITVWLVDIEDGRHELHSNC